MTGEPHLALLRHRHAPLEEIGDPLPVLLGTDATGLGQRVLPGPVVDEGAVIVPAAALGRFGADDAEDAEVVLERRNARLGGVADHLANGVDLAVPLRTFAE